MSKSVFFASLRHKEGAELPDNVEPNFSGDGVICVPRDTKERKFSIIKAAIHADRIGMKGKKKTRSATDPRERQR